MLPSFTTMVYFSCNDVDHSSSLTSFTHFNRLPLELRIKIWRLCMPQYKGQRTITVEQSTAPITIYGQTVTETKIKLRRSGEPLPNALLACTEAITNSDFCRMGIYDSDEGMIMNPKYDTLRLSLTDLSPTFVLDNLIDVEILNRIENVELHGNWTAYQFHLNTINNLQLFPGMKNLDLTANGFIGPDHRAPPNLCYKIKDDVRDIASKSDFPEGQVLTPDHLWQIKSGSQILRGNLALPILFDRVTSDAERSRILESVHLIRACAREVSNFPSTVFVRFDYICHTINQVGCHFKLVPRKAEYDFSDVLDGLVSPNSLN